MGISEVCYDLETHLQLLQQIVEGVYNVDVYAHTWRHIHTDVDARTRAQSHTHIHRVNI